MSSPAPTRITIVHAGQSHPWASWMRSVLVVDGAEPVLQRWDPLHQPPHPDALAELIDASGRVLIVLDDWFLQFDDGRRQAWVEILRTTVPRHRERFAAVTVTAAELPGDAQLLDPVVQLRGLGPAGAARALRRALALGPPRQDCVDLARGPRFPDDVHEVHNAPRHNRYFTGREKVLTRLHDAFAAGGDGARVALRGHAGLGKTQTAIEYVHRFGGEYDIVWWVNAALRARARDEFAALADAMDRGREAGDSLRSRIETAKRTLAGRERWLLVFDGAEEPRDLEVLLPDGPGHLLITTPRTDWASRGAELVELMHFEREESVALARLRAPRLSPQSADELAATVQDVPLLLDQTTAWIGSNPAADIDTYVRELREGDPNTTVVAPSPEYDERPFQAAWSRTINTLHERHPAAHELLTLLAFFSPDVVPVRLLRKATVAELPGHLAALVGEPSSWNAALRALSEATSMNLEYEAGPRQDIVTVGTLRMHRLFHRFVRHQLAPEVQTEASAIARRVLVANDPRAPGESANWARYAELLPHLEPSGAVRSTDPDVRTLVLNCIEYLRVRGEYKEGRTLSAAAAKAWEHDSGPRDSSVLIALHQLAALERRSGNYAIAEDIGRGVLTQVMEPDGEEPPRPIEVLRARNNLGGTLMALGRYDEARALYEEAAEQAERELGSEAVPRTLAVRGNLAIAIGLQGRYEEAYELDDSVLRASIRLLGGKHQVTLNIGLHTAQMLRLLGRYGDALALQEHNYRLSSQVLDPTHSQTLLSQHNLALCLRREGKTGQARAMMRQIQEHLLLRRGAGHPETLMVSTDLAMLLRDADDLDRARELAEDARDRYEALLGGHHPYAAGLLDNCALIQRSQGEHGDALVRAEEARTRMERLLGPGHVWSIGAAMNSASARAATGDLPGAVDLGRDALTRARTAVGDRHVLALNLAAGLTQDLRASGQAAEAAAVHETAVRGLSEEFFAEHRQIKYMFEDRRPYWDFEPQTI